VSQSPQIGSDTASMGNDPADNTVIAVSIPSNRVRYSQSCYFLWYTLTVRRSQSPQIGSDTASPAARLPSSPARTVSIPSNRVRYSQRRVGKYQNKICLESQSPQIGSDTASQAQVSAQINRFCQCLNPLKSGQIQPGIILSKGGMILPDVSIPSNRVRYSQSTTNGRIT